ncbi:unnamed protein product, partial [Leptidea sinapis]
SPSSILQIVPVTTGSKLSEWPKYVTEAVGSIFMELLADKLPAQLEELNLRPRTKSKHSYTIRRLSIKDKEPVIEFLRRCYELEEYAASTLEDGVSTAVVDENGEFVGVVINGVVSREEVDYTDKSEECPHPKFKRILKLLSHLDREARIWDKLPASCKKVMEVRIASTHTSWRGRGLMRVLCEESDFNFTNLLVTTANIKPRKRHRTI